MGSTATAGSASVSIRSWRSSQSSLIQTKSLPSKGYSATASHLGSLTAPTRGGAYLCSGHRTAGLDSDSPSR